MLIRSIIHYVFDILIFLSSLITICSCMINGCVSFCTRSALGSKYLEVAWVKTEPNWSKSISVLIRCNMCCYLIEDFPVSVMIRLRFLVFLPLHRTTQMYCYFPIDTFSSTSSYSSSSRKEPDSLIECTWFRFLYAYYPLANEVAKGYSNATVRPSFRNILVNTLESTSFNGFWPNLVHT